MMKKRMIYAVTFATVMSLFLIFCLLALAFGFYWAGNGMIVIRILAFLNLMGYRSYIGGHTAHSSNLFVLLIWFLGLVYSSVNGYLVTLKINLHKKLIFMFVFLISFILYFFITSIFLIELERFAYSFFVPQV